MLLIVGRELNYLSCLNKQLPFVPWNVSREKLYQFLINVIILQPTEISQKKFILLQEKIIWQEFDSR